MTSPTMEYAKWERERRRLKGAWTRKSRQVTAFGGTLAEKLELLKERNKAREAYLAHLRVPHG